MWSSVEKMDEHAQHAMEQAELPKASLSDGLLLN